MFNSFLQIYLTNSFNDSSYIKLTLKNRSYLLIETGKTQKMDNLLVVHFNWIIIILIVVIHLVAVG